MPTIASLLIPLLLAGLMPSRSPSLSETKPYYEGFHQGQGYRSYLVKAKRLNDQRWKVTVKSVGDPPNPREKPFYWINVVDCQKQTVGEGTSQRPIPKDWRDSSEKGLPELYEAVCGKKPM